MAPEEMQKIDFILRALSVMNDWDSSIEDRQKLVKELVNTLVKQ